MKLPSWLTPQEAVVVGISGLISALILSSMVWIQPIQQGENPYQLLAYDIRIEDATGKRLDPFYTIFFANYEAKAPVEEKQAVVNLLTDSVQRLHPYADRHHLFFKDPQQPQLGYIHNLKVLNEAYGQSHWLEIDEPFYRLLEEAKMLTILTQGQFNMFLGHVSDFWDARLSDPQYWLNYQDLDPAFNPIHRADILKRLSFVPKQPEAVEATLELKIEAGKYYARFNEFADAEVGELKISLGAIAKGFANDRMTDALFAQGLTRGYISNGTSSISTMGPRYANKPYQWQLTSPHASAQYALTILKPGRHQLSTSGAYTGFRMPIGSISQLRHHIIDPRTGYPSQQAIELNVISTSFSAAGLDALSTAFMTMSQAEAFAYRQQIILQGYDLEIAWVEVINERVHVTYTEGYQPFIQREANVRYQIYRS
jgi:thiamine biosynthesis lipoprotein ApbE